ncbi:N-acetylmuramoyl-L-alanine amidase [Oceaniglobus trochenteri]|uniref:N-acetylmuramoyl-L-alanine amidase n=1 Tax=Oceaniglobus trochenteri TaxID=2763260 RepID=UPI001CFFFCED|nr:N-acetylmuramoyl-L-alanine amidase [Oceaniglobus trochenteri]
MIYQGKARYPVHEVILHTSATPGDWWKGKTPWEMRQAIWEWHVHDNGWSDIGYHRVVPPQGGVVTGRSIYRVGAHVKERNRGTIGICMIPVRTHAGIKTFEDYFTPEQRESVRSYIADLRTLTDITKVSGHNDYANKECPGFKVRSEDWLK